MKKLFLLTFFTLALVSCEEEIPNYTVTVSSSPAEGGSVSPQGGEYQQGQTATFTATPNEFYGFAGWSGADTSTINPVSIIVDTNKSLTARFEKLDTDNDGITDDVDQCPDTPSNEQADSNGCSVSQKEFELIIATEGEGTVTEQVVVAPTIYQGTTQVQLTAVPAEGWELSEWTGDLTGNENPVTIEIDGTKNITAVFTKKDTDGDGVPDLEDTCADTPEGEEADENGCSLSQKDFELTVTTEGEGTVTEELIVSPSMYKGTSQVKLTAVPAEGWEFKEWTGDATGSENPITIEIDGAKSITAVFTKKDTDGDGVPDLEDSCPDTPEGEEADENGCAPSQKDTDGDGVTDDIDQCDSTGNDVRVDENGCPQSPIYLDSNGVTIKAQDWAEIGDTGEINGVTYTVVSGWELKYWVSYGIDPERVCTSKITSMAGFFFHPGGSYTMASSHLKRYSPDLDISSWDVSNVTSMEGMFKNHENTSDLSHWDVSNVTNMSGMFANAGGLSGISNWDVSNVEDMSSMFIGAYNILENDISDWDVSNVTNMSEMFRVSPTIEGMDLSNWNVSNVKDMSGMFRDSATYNFNISDWDVSNVEDMSWMFGGSNVDEDLSSWDVSNVSNMSYMFRGGVFSGEKGSLSNWDVSNVTTMREMFRLNGFYNDNLSQWNVSKVKDCYRFSQQTTRWALPKPNFTSCNPN